MSLRLAIIGKTGQLARALLREGEDMGHKIIALDRDALDLTSSPQDIEMVVETLRSGIDAFYMTKGFPARLQSPFI